MNEPDPYVSPAEERVSPLRTPIALLLLVLMSMALADSLFAQATASVSVSDSVQSSTEH
ncbi:MAG: hypothetical protein AAF270_15400 [Pseudomonadota bacterium]